MQMTNVIWKPDVRQPFTRLTALTSKTLDFEGVALYD